MATLITGAINGEKNWTDDICHRFLLILLI